MFAEKGNGFILKTIKNKLECCLDEYACSSQRDSLNCNRREDVHFCCSFYVMIFFPACVRVHTRAVFSCWDCEKKGCVLMDGSAVMDSVSQWSPGDRRMEHIITLRRGRYCCEILIQDEVCEVVLLLWFCDVDILQQGSLQYI